MFCGDFFFFFRSSTWLNVNPFPELAELKLDLTPNSDCCRVNVKGVGVSLSLGWLGGGELGAGGEGRETDRK